MIPGYTKTAFMKLAAEQYIISSGDTLEGLDRRHNVPVGTFKKLNPGVIPEKLRVGAKLNLPPGVKPIYRTRQQPVANKNSYVRTRPAGVKLVYFPTVEQHGSAIRYSEHAGTPVERQMIRTKVKPEIDPVTKKYKDYSTAFGWGQITGSTGRGFMDDPVYGEYMRRKHGVFWDTYMDPMYKGFKDWSDTWHSKTLPIPTHKVWGFGGHGNFPRDQWENYDKFAYDIMKLKIMEHNRSRGMRDRASMSPEEYTRRQVRYWSGPQKDDYMEKYLDHLYKTNPELFSDYQVPALTPEQLVQKRKSMGYPNTMTDEEIQRKWNEAVRYRLKNRSTIFNPTLD
jgi:LysM repeat protein